MLWSVDSLWGNGRGRKEWKRKDNLNLIDGLSFHFLKCRNGKIDHRGDCGEDKQRGRWTLSWNDISINNIIIINSFRIHIPQIADNEIEAEGCRVIAKALKTNTLLKKLYLQAMHTTLFLFFHMFPIIGNKIEVKGSSVIAEALEKNGSLTELNLYLIHATTLFHSS